MSPLARLFVAVIGLYRRVISPLLPRSCRYEPTCSAYAAEAVRVHGALRGVALSLRRVARC
ncbi:MAG TPA: membrane protein insertion efficiency factor YidD, partial [Actinomycetota bacterium]|nr:membrane protein insertion efficiency factor YidD [Actinomycetota bacterium]